MTTKTTQAGYRLDTVEWYGWGTFHDTWKMDLGGETTLLTGANGSGKSTVIDAILTLLIPNRERNYNKAAGGKKTDRTVDSYLLGRHGKIRVGNVYKDQDLREKNGYHVLIGTFKNYALDKTVTLAQVYYWSNGSLKNPIYIVSEQLLTVHQHFMFDKHTRIKPYLNKLPNTTIYTTFKAYAEDFRRLFHMGEKAQALINQIVAIKEIPRLDEFVRDNMLEAIDVDVAITGLRDKFSDLDNIYEKIKSAEAQERLLKPLVKNNEEYQSALKNSQSVEGKIESVAMFFADKRINLLQTAIDDIEKKQLIHQRDIERHEATLSDLQAEQSRLEISLAQNSVRLEIQSIEADIKLLDTQIKHKQEKAGDYQRYIQHLTLPQALNETVFEDNKQHIQAEKDRIDQEIEALQEQVNQLGAERVKLDTEYDDLYDEIESLKGRTSQIDRRAIQIRERIATALDISIDRLPYIGELLKVRDDAQDWESSVQYLLRDFALKMLVPDKDFEKVSAYVEANNLRGRLDYDHVKQAIKVPQLDEDSIYHKLEIKSDNPFGKNIVAGLLARQYGAYVACETLDDLHAHDGKAITRNRHIKRSRMSYTKDDRPNVINPSEYRLGWNNQQKIDLLLAQLDEINEKKHALKQKIDMLKGEQNKRNNDVLAIKRLLDYQDFTLIDWKSLDSQRNAKQQRREGLIKSNDNFRQLEQELNDKKAEIKVAQSNLSKSKDSESQLRFELGEKRRRLDNDNQRYPHDLRESKAKILHEIGTDINETITLENERNTQNDYDRYLRTAKKEFDDEIVRVTNLVQRRMNDYNKQFVQLAVNLVSEIEAITDYLERYQYIIEQDLPQHKSRFKELLQKHLGDEISSFRGRLLKQYDEYKNNIEGLNRSLQQIPYDRNKGTYIQLIIRKTQHAEIRNFERELESCIPDPYADEDGIDERQYILIRELIERLFNANEQRWRKLVTDVRNWLDIDAQEFSIETHEGGQVYESSSGKSGGQKAKLAYTILASAVAYQYGLHDEWHRDERFRFVMVDEVFSKSDEQNSHYAMELFKTLHLQILVVTPSDKMHIVLPYIGTCCIVSNPNQDKSTLASIRIHDVEEFKDHWEKGTLEAYATDNASEN